MGKNLIKKDTLYQNQRIAEMIRGLKSKRIKKRNYWFENRVDLRIDWFEIKSI
jgi:hypothetical protein